MKIPYPGENELFIRIEYVIDFTLQHFDRIALYLPLWGKLEREGLENKIAHEFSLFVFLVSRIKNRPDSLDKSLQKALNSLSGFIRTQTNYLRILNDPQNSTRFGQINFFLTKAGNVNNTWDNLIIRMYEKGYGENSERILTRFFDKNWLNHIIFNKNIYNPETIIKYSILNSRCHPVYMSVSEMYAFTHTLMYISDFGKCKIVNYSDNSSLKNIINSSLLFQLANENYDLLGEFLMNYSYTENTWDLVPHISWKYFTSIWDDLGFLPGIAFDSKIYSQLDNEDKSAYAFKEVYHTNLVAGILCVNILEANERNSEISVEFPPEFSINKHELFKIIQSGKLYYNILNQETESLYSFDTIILFSQVQELIERNEIPPWFKIISDSNDDTINKNAILIELKIMLSIKKSNFQFLIVSINQYLNMNLKINRTFVEAVEFICSRQMESGEFLIPKNYIPSILNTLSKVYDQIN